MYKRYILFSILIIVLGLLFFSKKNDVQVTKDMDHIISQHIISHYKNVYGEADKQFEAHKVYGATEKRGIITIYIYSVYKGFNKGETTESIGHSLPARVKLKKDNITYKVMDYKEPKDGSEYSLSINNIFPRSYIKKVSTDAGNVPELHAEINKQLQKWQQEY